MMENHKGIGYKERKHNRLYTIEFFRVWFILIIILGHALVLYPPNKKAVYQFFFNSSAEQYWFGVELFCIIGGFFLYRRIAAGVSPLELVKKTYYRLMCPLMFAFILSVFVSNIHWSGFIRVISLVGGTGLFYPAAGWGEWFNGAYFWGACLLIGLFGKSHKQGFFSLGIIMFVTLCLKLHLPKSQDNSCDTYYMLCGVRFLRIIYSLGFGFIASYIVTHIQIPSRWYTCICLTVFEIYALYSVNNFLARPEISNHSYYEMEVLFSLLLISLSQSQSVISYIFNKFGFIQKISRYMFPMLMGQIVMMNLMQTHNAFGLDYITGISTIMVGSFVLGVIEYHLVERTLVPIIDKYLTTPKKADDNTITAYGNK